MKIEPFFVDIDINVEEDEYAPPPYGLAGRILVDVQEPEDDNHRGYFEVLDYDSETSVYWINEGLGFDHFFEQFEEEFPETGRYVVPNVIGYYYKGDGWHTDDDEEWEHGRPFKVGNDVEVMDDVDKLYKISK